MRRYGAAVLLLLTGGAVLRISLFSELYLRYVQVGLRPYLVVSGVVLVVLGVVAAAAVARGSGEDEHEHEHDQAQDHDDHGHSHSHGHGYGHGPRIAWLLTLPALALLLFPPPALGSYSADREAAQQAAQGVGAFPALPAGNPLPLTVGEFSSRAIFDSGRSLTGRTVSLTGFVTHGDDGTWYVTRLLVSCCAADAAAGKVEIRDADAPVTDTWVTVTGTWVPKGKLGSDAAWPPVLDAGSVKKVPEPSNPYEKR
ncbi:TIGR03943 family putative permease subunit [Streptomyces adonidis]|uniref:TIGR03943 family protein n=1 Tax=Streptomyces sp. NBC_00093 TaxID=2975649 RepID=A0AAU2A107_9ACTN